MYTVQGDFFNYRDSNFNKDIFGKYDFVQFTNLSSCINV